MLNLQEYIVILLELILLGFFIFLIKKLTFRSFNKLAQDKISKIKYKISKKERIIKRANTIGSLLSSLIVFILLLVFIWIFAEAMNISFASVLASISIASLIIGLGMQQIIGDFIAGIFIIIEDQFGIGDYIKIGDIKGEVVNIGFRVTEIIDSKGVIWYIRNGEITKVGNYSQKVI